MTDFWMPILDNEWEVLHRDYPGIVAERRDGAWCIHVVATVTSEARARELMELTIAEALAGHPIHKLPKAN